MDINIGLTYEFEITVEEKDTALQLKSGCVHTFATPAMIAIMEKASMSAVEKYLDEGFTTVGTKIEVKHLAATPVGMKVKAKAELVDMDKKRLLFKVEAWDEAGLIGEGIHERYIVETNRFLDKAQKRFNLRDSKE